MTLPGIGFRRTTGAVARHPFVWRARDMVAQSTLAAASGQAATFVQATRGTAFASDGRLYTTVHSQPRFDAVLNSVTGSYEQTLSLEGARTNLCLQSENFGTTWVALFTPTRVAAAKTCGDLVLDLIGDDSSGAGVQEGYEQAVTFTGNAVKSFSVHVAKGLSAPAGGSEIVVVDTTASANRCRAALDWDAGGAPLVSGVTGVYIGSRALANGVYRLLFQTTSVTAVNTNKIRVLPAMGSTDTGNLYMGGVQCEDAPMPSSYIKTTTATVTRDGDALSYPALWPLQDNETWYIRMARPSWADMAGSLGDAYVLSRGATGARQAIRFDSGARTILADVYDGTILNSVGIAIPAGVGGFIEAAIQFANLKTAGKVRIDVGAGYGSYSSTTGLIASLTPTLVVGDAASAAGNQLNGGLTDLAIVSGLQTLATMRGIVQR